MKLTELAKLYLNPTTFKSSELTDEKRYEYLSLVKSVAEPINDHIVDIRGKIDAGLVNNEQLQRLANAISPDMQRPLQDHKWFDQYMEKLFPEYSMSDEHIIPTMVRRRRKGVIEYTLEMPPRQFALSDRLWRHIFFHEVSHFVMGKDILNIDSHCKCETCAATEELMAEISATAIEILLGWEPDFELVAYYLIPYMGHLAQTAPMTEDCLVGSNTKSVDELQAHAVFNGILAARYIYATLKS